MFWRVQMSQMQKEVDEWKLLGQYGTGVYQVSYQRVPSQTGATPLSLHFPVQFTYARVYTVQAYHIAMCACECNAE